MGNLGLMGSNDETKLKILRMFVDFVETHDCGLKIEKRFSKYEDHIYVKNGDGFNKYFTHDKLTFVDTETGKTHIIFVPGGKIEQAAIRIGLLDVSRIVRQIICVFTLDEPLETQFKFFDVIKYLPKKASVLFTNLDKFPENERDRILEIKKNKIISYLKNRRIIFDEFHLIYFDIDKPNLIEQNKNTMKLIIKLTTGRNLAVDIPKIKTVESKKYQKKNFQSSQRIIQKTTPNDMRKSKILNSNNEKQKKYWLNRGNTSFEQEDYEKAKNCYEKVLEIDSNDVVAWSGLGYAYYEKNNYQEAIRCYKRALEIDPNYALAWANLGIVRDDQKNYQEAIRCYKKALEFNQNFVQIWNNLGSIYSYQKNFQETISCFEKVLEIDSNDVVAWSGLGYAYYEKNNYQEAIRCYKRALEIDPNYALAWANLGIVGDDQKNYQEAIRCYKKALENDSKIAPVLYNLGSIYSYQKNYQEAIRCYKSALEIDPNYALAWVNLGFTHQHQNNYKESIRCIKKALEIDPNYALAWNNLGIAYNIQKNYQEATHCYKMALEIDPNHALAWNNLGLSHQHQNNYYEAIRCYNRALEIDPNYALAWNYLGITHNTQKNYQEAIRCFKKALQIEPNNVSAKIKLLDIKKKLDKESLNSEKEVALSKTLFEILSIEEKYLLYNRETGKRAIIRGRKTNNYKGWESENQNSMVDLAILTDIQNQLIPSFKGNGLIKNKITLMEIKIIREYEYFHGQIRFKIGFINNTDTVITDLDTNFRIPEALKWVGHEPDFKRMGNSVLIPKLNPGEKKAISLYLEPINCMEGNIRATISYSDARNRLHTAIMKDKTINITCPIFFTPEDANPARVKSLYKSLKNKDRKRLPLPSGNETKIFSLIQSAIGSHDIKLITKEFSLEEKIGGLMYYGVTKVKQNCMVIKAFLDGKQQVIELEVAGNSEDSITSLLAEIQNQLRTSFLENELIKNQNAFMEMKTGVILRICPYCGSEIKSEDQIKYKNGEDISCEWCDHFILNY